MIDQRNIPKGQVPCVTVLGPSEPPKPRPEFYFGFDVATDSFLRFRTAAYYGATVHNPAQPTIFVRPSS